MRVCFLAGFLSLFVVGSAFAHALLAIVKIEETSVRVEVFYDDDTPAEAAKVYVQNDAKEKIAEGVTDANGAWTFTKPVLGTYTVVAESVGHRHRKSFTIGENITSTQPTREELTRTPFVAIGVGLGVILLVSVMLAYRQS